MTVKNTTQNPRSRNLLLTQAAAVLHRLGRDGSAKVMRRYLRPDLTDAKAQSEAGVRARFQPPTPGYQIAERLNLTSDGSYWKSDVIGIVREGTANQLRHYLIPTDLPFDGYDRILSENAPAYLVIEADALAERFGWQHALTLRDPAATAELALLVQKARAAGIKAILIRPVQVHRFPLLSRVVDIFDHVVDDPAGFTKLRDA